MGFGIDDEEIQQTDADDRFQRPIAVAIFGCLLSTAGVALIMVKSRLAFGTDTVFLLIFLAFAWTASCTYAFLGWRFSRAVAHRTIGVAGGIVALAGIGYLFWLLLTQVT